MEREIKNNRDSIDTSLSDERTEALAASEMADRGPKAIDTTKGDWPDADGKTTLMGVSNPEEDIDEEDDEDDDIDLEDDEDLNVAAPADTELDTVEIDDADIEDDLDIELDDEEEEEEDI
ncbi:MAG TPA: hypothetical protein VNA26_08020 [Chitinophagaceae bacterium]|nr:hypothetical protein [Chitinophagaceae bacterium]